MDFRLRSIFNPKSLLFGAIGTTVAVALLSDNRVDLLNLISTDMASISVGFKEYQTTVQNNWFSSALGFGLGMAYQKAVSSLEKGLFGTAGKFGKRVFVNMQTAGLAGVVAANAYIASNSDYSLTKAMSGNATDIGGALLEYSSVLATHGTMATFIGGVAALAAPRLSHLFLNAVKLNAGFKPIRCSLQQNLTSRTMINKSLKSVAGAIIAVPLGVLSGAIANASLAGYGNKIAVQTFDFKKIADTMNWDIHFPDLKSTNEAGSLGDAVNTAASAIDDVVSEATETGKAIISWVTGSNSDTEVAQVVASDGVEPTAEVVEKTTITFSEFWSVFTENSKDMILSTNLNGLNEIGSQTMNTLIKAGSEILNGGTQLDTALLAMSPFGMGLLVTLGLYRLIAGARPEGLLRQNQTRSSTAVSLRPPA